MAIVVGGTTTNSLQLAYQFEFAIKNGKAVEKDVLINSFSHNEDSWQLELKRVVDDNNDSQSDFSGKLRLISSSSEWKVVGICVQRDDDGDVFDRQRVKDTAILFKSGGELDIGTFFIDQIDLKVLVEVLKYAKTKPHPKRMISVAKSTLSAEVLMWFDREDFGDVVVVAKNGKEFRCHRDILTRRCEVLGWMFNHPGMKEASGNVVNLKNLDEEIVAAMLQFLYLDKCGELGPIAYPLYIAADQYQLDRLKNLSESALAANLSDGNVVKILQLAEEFHLKDLMTKCVDYLAINRCGKSTVPKAAEEPKVKQSGQAEPVGLTITSKVVDNGKNDRENGSFPIVYKFAFTANNYSDLGKVVLSNEFSHNGDVWQLELKKAGDNDVRCRLHLVDTKTEELKMACVGYIVDVYFYDSDDDSDTEDRYSPKYVTETTPVALFQHSGDAHDFGRLFIDSGDGDAKIVVQLVKWAFAENPADSESPKMQMATEVLNWFQTEDFGDVTIVAADGKKFCCHQDILSARSEVFKLKFNCQVSEESELVGNADFSGEIVAPLLLFIYTDDCGNIGPIADRLYVAADHFKLDRLKNLCESALAARLSPDTFMKTYRLANSYDLKKLMAVCSGYLETHKAVLPVANLFSEAIKFGEGPKGEHSKSE